VRPSSGRDPLQARSTGVRLLPGDRAAATWTSSASLEHPGLVGRPGLTNRAGGRAADGLTDSVAYILIAANATNLPGALTRRGRGGSRASDGGGVQWWGRQCHSRGPTVTLWAWECSSITRPVLLWTLPAPTRGSAAGVTGHSSPRGSPRGCRNS